jgi:hypothetical protein
VHRLPARLLKSYTVPRMATAADALELYSWCVALVTVLALSATITDGGMMTIGVGPTLEFRSLFVGKTQRQCKIWPPAEKQEPAIAMRALASDNGWGYVQVWHSRVEYCGVAREACCCCYGTASSDRLYLCIGPNIAESRASAKAARTNSPCTCSPCL